MYESANVSDDADRTAFRRAEKKYKLYYEQDSKFSRKKKLPKPVDLSELLDFNLISQDFNKTGLLPHGIRVAEADSSPVFCIENRPGFYFIPGALSLEEQCRWIKESLMNFPQPPNRTNHNAIYGPIADLFDSAKQNKVLVQEDLTNNKWKFYEEEDVAKAKQRSCKSVSASVLLRKLRWSTLGLQFDWSKRNYDVSLPHNNIPDALCQLAKTHAAIAMPVGEEFRPEGAIVNYFGLGDTLGGHLDDMEVDWSKPIVSMSLGCKAIFLLGGKLKDDPPHAMYLRSGDVVLMAGEARECYHGVPRIFTDEENAEIGALESELSHESEQFFAEYIKTSRININISFSEIKINLHYGGLMKYEYKTVNYIGGSLKHGIVIDPDYMTWSMFDSFCEDNGIPGLVEHAWYKLPHQDMSSVKTILELNSDADINEMCAAAIRVGEVDIFLENKRDSDNGDKAVENEKGEVQREEGHDAGKEKGCVCEREEAHGAESESESNGVGDGERTEVEEDVVEEVLAEGDTRFTSFFEEIRNQEATGLGDLHDNIREAADEGRDTHHDEAELEKQCRDVKHPTPAENNDDEWEDFNRKEREVSRTRYNNEKPPYLWLLQKFNSGEEFKEQILRYVLKGMDATFPLTLVEFLKYGDLELQIWMLATPNQPQGFLTFSRFCCMLCIHDHYCF